MKETKEVKKKRRNEQRDNAANKIKRGIASATPLLTILLINWAALCNEKVAAISLVTINL